MVIEHYLEKNICLDGFNVLKLRMGKAIPHLKKDLELIELVLEKLGKD